MIQTIHIKQKRYNLPHVRAGFNLPREDERKKQIELLKKQKVPDKVVDYFIKDQYNEVYIEPFGETINKVLTRYNVQDDELIDIKFSLTSAGTSEDYFTEREALVIYKC